MNAIPNQPRPDARDELLRLLPDLVERELPGDRQRQLQEFVMSEIDREPVTADRRARRARRLVLATSAVAAAALVAVAIGSGSLGDQATGGAATAGGSRTGAGPKAPGGTPVQPAFELAAVHAATESYTAPRPNQWIYIEDRNTATGAVERDKGQQPVTINKTWSRADGRKSASIDPQTGKVASWNDDNGYPALAALPTDPQALLDRLRAELQATATPGPDGRTPPLAATPTTPEQWNDALFVRIFSILSRNLLPPDVTAALWRAAGMIPGVTQEPGTIEVDGRKVIAVGRVVEGWRFEQLLLDPATHDFVGYRAVAVKNHTFQAPDRTVTVPKGEAQYTVTRVTAKVVDALGQTD